MEEALLNSQRGVLMSYKKSIRSFLPLRLWAPSVGVDV